jgi:hypothetical protein|nr:right-handed parallel beta-helix repeat-containing protein [Acutalibacter muris]
MVNEFVITDFGALPDGIADCTEAIQAALDRAGEVSGAVIVPPGTYLTGRVKLPSHVQIKGTPAWSYRSAGGSVLKLKDADSKCLLDITGTIGSRISGLCLDGDNLGEEIHGLCFGREDFFDRTEEDTFVIEDCQVRRFSGNGLHLRLACCFAIRHCHIMENGGDGIYTDSWDGFLLDNQISYNGGWGVRCAPMGINNSAYTCTGNRVEWNQKGGFYLRHSRLWNITGNCFDRSGGPAIKIDRSATAGDAGDSRWVEMSSQTITINGNIFNRSGADFQGDLPERDSCHLSMSGCFGVTVTGNSFLLGRDDAPEGNFSPKHSIVMEKLKGCVIANNTMWKASRREPILDMGGHGEQVCVRDNMACPVPQADLDKGGRLIW